MKKSDIKVGDVVAVYITNLRPPDIYRVSGTGKDEAFPHGMIRDGNGITAFYDPAGTEYERSQVAVATVIEVGARRLTGTRYGRSVYQTNDGILVKFTKPQEAGVNAIDDRVKVLTAVVTPRFIIAPWADVIRRRAATDEFAAKQKAEGDKKALDFGPYLAEFIDTLKEIGLNVEPYGDSSGLHGDVDVQLARVGEYDNRKVVGFGREARVPTAIFRELVKIAAKHGETVGATADEDD